MQYVSNLQEWWENLSWQMASKQTPDEIYLLLGQSMTSHGFTYYAHGIKKALSFSNAKTTVYGTYPDEWKQRYNEMNYGADDPCISSSLDSGCSVVWDKRLQKQNEKLFNEAKECGLKFGITLSVRSIGNTISVVSLAREYEPISLSERLNLSLK
ncbi:autoinducer binding domain-containing protein [Pseudomonas asuensis]